MIREFDDMPTMSKRPQNFADSLPSHLRRACSCMSGDGGFKDWLDARFGAGKWALCEYPRGEIETAISNHQMGDLAVEYGHARLKETFAVASHGSETTK